MADKLDQLVQLVRKKLQTLRLSSPRVSVVRAAIRTAYFASLKTEEGRFVRGSVTLADPANPDIDPPLLRRADYPAFAAFREPIPFNVETVVKLSRAVDSWSASIVMYGTTVSDLHVWGILDQLVSHNLRLHHESEGGFSGLGIITVNMDAVGDLSVYHKGLFLGALRQDRVIRCQTDALRSEALSKRITPYLRPIASKISKVDGIACDKPTILESLLQV